MLASWILPKKTTDPWLAMIARLNRQSTDIRTVHQGGFIMGGFSGNLIIEQMIGRGLTMEEEYPEFSNVFAERVDADSFNNYGVCDSPDQLFTAVGDLLIRDERLFLVAYSHITKDPSNKGQGGGWRWHKWGPYIGKGSPSCEYLDDEEGFENGVYVYHIYYVQNTSHDPV